jgi:NitT/TauT family transport system ATP-binding protein
MIQVRNVAKAYGGRVVLSKINLDIAPGSFVALVGPSGCGKTTLLRMLMSEERPTSGEITISGTPLPGEPTAERGVVFQRYSVFPHLTVTGNVVLGLEMARARFLGRLFGAARRHAEAEAHGLLEEVGLAEHAAKYPAQLSGGMQQRLALAQALATKPRVLLLDEPFGALDPGIKADIHDLMLRLWKTAGMTVVMVTHDLSEAFKLGTRVVVLDRREDTPTPETGATVTMDIDVWRRKPKGARVA